MSPPSNNMSKSYDSINNISKKSTSLRNAPVVNNNLFSAIDAYRNVENISKKTRHHIIL